MVVPMNGNEPENIPVDGNGPGQEAPPPGRAVYNSREARFLLGDISEPMFRKLTKSGELRARKIGSFVYVEPAEIERFVKSRPFVGVND
jgi:hypothetical protein